MKELAQAALEPLAHEQHNVAKGVAMMQEELEAFDEMTGPMTGPSHPNASIKPYCNDHNCWNHQDSRAINETTHGQDAPACIASSATDGAYSDHERHVRRIGILEYQSAIMGHPAYRAVPVEYRGDLLQALVDIQRRLAASK